MASKKIKGITIEIGGDTTKLGKALDESTRASANLQTELNSVNRLLKFDPSNVEALTQKQTLLNDKIEATTQTLNTLKEAEDQITAQFNSGEIGAEQYREFQRELMYAQNSLDSMGAQLEETNRALQLTNGELAQSSDAFADLSATINKQETELKDLKDEYTKLVLEQGEGSQEAQQLASKITSLNADLNDNKQRLDDARQSAEKLAPSFSDVGNKADDAGGGFTIMKGALADLTANAVSFAISALGDLVGSLFDLVEASEEYLSMQAKLEGASLRSGYSADYTAQKYKEMYAYLGDDQMATNAVTNLLGIEAEQETLNALLEGATGVWATYGDSIPIESFTEATNETIQVAKVTGTFADAINWVSVSNEKMAQIMGDGTEAQKAFNGAIADGETQEDAFSAALAATSDQQERAQLVANFLNQTYGESKATYDQLTESIRNTRTAEVELKDTQAEVAQSIAPLHNEFTNLKTQALDALKPSIDAIVGALMDMITWLKEHPVVLELLTGLVIGLAVAFGVLATALGIGAIISAVQFALAGLATVIGAMSLPITLIVAAIAGLVAAFIYLWNNCEWFKNMWLGIWDAIKGAFDAVITWIINFLTVTIPENFNAFIAFLDGIWASITTGLSTALNAVITWASNLWSTMTTWVSKTINDVVNWFKGLPGKISTQLSTALNYTITWGRNMVTQAVSATRKLVTDVINKLKELPSMVVSVGADIVRGIWDGISGAAGWLMGKIKGFVDDVVSNIKGFFGIHSPSKKMAEEVGPELPAGIGVGIEENARAAIDPMQQVVNDMVNGVDGMAVQQEIKSSLTLDDVSQSFTGSQSNVLETLNQVVALLSGALPTLTENSEKIIVLNDGTLVGALTPSMDARLADLSAIKRRGG